MQDQMAIARHTPQWRLSTDLTVGFIDNSLDGTVHPAFDNGDVAFSHLEDKYVVDLDKSCEGGGAQLASKIIQPMTESTDEMKKQIELFQGAVRSYAEKKVGPKRESKSRDDFTIKEFNTWSDVQSAIRSAVVAEKSKSKDFSGRVTRIADAFAKASPTVVSFLDFLPKDAFGGSSVLCGALTMVFQGAERLTKIREETYSAIENIPMIIRNALDLAQVYTQNEFEAHVSSLFVGILDLLHTIFDWYAANIVGKIWKSILQGDEYGRMIRNKKSKMESSTKEIDQRAVVFQHQRVERLETSINKVYTHTRSQTAAQATLVKNSMREQLRIDELLGLQRWLAEVESRKYQKERQRQLHEQDMIEKERANRRRKRYHLQHKLELPSESTVTDMREVIETGLGSRNKMKKRAAYISYSDEVELWLASAKAEVLIINSDERPEQITAASLFCALLVQSLDLVKPAVCLYWFCGLHSQTPISHMIRSLGAQLLEQCDDRMDPPRRYFQRDLSELRNALDALESLVKQQIRFSPIFFVLDDFTSYDDGDDVQDFASLLQCLWDIADDDGDDVNCIKVVMTNPGSFTSNNLARFASATMDVPSYLGHLANYALNTESLTDGMASNADRGLKEARPWEMEGRSEDEYQYQMDFTYDWDIGGR